MAFIDSVRDPALHCQPQQGNNHLRVRIFVQIRFFYRKQACNFLYNNNQPCVSIQTNVEGKGALFGSLSFFPI